MDVTCPYCQAPIAQTAIDEARQIADCRSCGRLVDLLRHRGAPAAPRVRELGQLPPGMEMRRSWRGKRGEGEAGLEITRRWLRAKHFPMLALGVAGAAGVALMWQHEVEPRGLVIFATFFVTMYAVNLIPMFVNTTRVRVADGEVDVRHGPLPSLLFRNQRVSTANLKQLYAAKWGSLYEVGAELHDGSRVGLVRPVINEEQALYIEQAIEQHLGIVDVPVDAELDAANLPPGEPAPVSAGAGGAIASVPLLMMALAVVIMSFVTASELEGSFTLRGALGDGTFTPTSCRSGQLQGFNGVELTAKGSPLVVRVMRDPTRGTLIALEQGGQQPAVIAPQTCKTLQVSVQRTSTNVNDVWGVRGSAVADCPDLQGTVTFDGCY